MRHPQFQSWIWMFCALSFVVPVDLYAQSSDGYPGARNPKKKEEKKIVRFEKSKISTNLDETQEKEVDLLLQRFQKLYGYSDELPDEAKDIVRASIFVAMDGIHQPKREETDKLSNDLMGVLQRKELGAIYAHKIVKGTAELLSDEELSKEEYDGLMIEIEQSLSGSRMSSERHEVIKADVVAIITNAKVNEEKLEAREKARKDEEERLEKERIKKLEEAKKRAARKSRSGGSGMGDGGSGRGSR